jgi:serine/threonine protein kinase
MAASSSNSVDLIDQTDPDLDEIANESEEDPYAFVDRFHPGLVMRKHGIILLQCIGSGRNAIVYLVYNINSDAYQAMKIQGDYYMEDGKREVKIIRLINKYAEAHPQEQSFCVELRKQFIYTMNDTYEHQCSVYDLYSGDVQRLLNTGSYRYGFPIPIAKKMIKQLVTATNYLHNKLKIMHTDIKPENILVKGEYDEHNTVIEIFENSGFKEAYEKLMVEYDKGNFLQKHNPKIYAELLTKLEDGSLATETYDELLENLNQNFNPKSAEYKIQMKQIKTDLDSGALGEKTFDAQVEVLGEEILEELIEDLGLRSVKDIADRQIQHEFDDEEYTVDDDFEDYDGADDLDEDLEADVDYGMIEEEGDVEDPEDKILNTRRQSIEDTSRDRKNLDTVNIEEIVEEYDFVNILKQFDDEEDGTCVIDDKYVKNIKIALTDFGGAYHIGKQSFDCEVQDRPYRAPEVILGYNYNTKIDVWSIGCVAFELVTGFTLFTPKAEPVNKDLQHLYLIEKQLGPIPLVMKKQAPRSEFLFDSARKYHIKNIEPFESVTLKHRLVEQFQIEESDADELVSFLNICLVYNPKNRASIAELLEHPWLKGIKV